MKKAMLSFSKPKKLFLLLSLFLVGSLFAQSSALFTQTANAATVTPEQCYALNGTDYNKNIKWMHTEEQDECVSQKYCEANLLAPLACSEDVYKRLTGKITVSASQCYKYNGSEYSSSIAGGSTPEQVACITQGYCKEDKSASYRKPLLCSEEVYKASEPYKAVQQAALVKAKKDALFGPVGKLICGEAPAGEAAQSVYIKCYDEAQAYYFECSVNASGPIGSENTAASSQELAKCLKEKTGTDATVAALQSAIDQGKTASDALTLPDPSAEGATCSDGQVLQDGKCVAATTACTGGTLGWIMCPLVTLASDTIKTVAPWMEKQLLVQPMVADSSQTKSLQAVWQIIVGIANLLLVIAFLVVIFSQATSLGLNAYGIKKMLPRIIAAAILINLSFFICAIVIDIFNVLGGSIKGIIDAGISVVASSTGTGKPVDYAELVTASITWVGIGFAAWGVGLLGYLVPLLLAGALAFLSMMVIIGMRQVLILLLVAISPLAFAAMILPGTEGLFKKWYKALGGLLVMYPIIMAILYGCSLVAMILLATAGGP